ncbi:MAG: trehalose-phosphatase, partial [Elusimicrobiales bacterium]|nr:trehalose-phosphatase [Elusimicrobiales bacterium]
SYLFDFWNKAPDKILTEKGELKRKSEKTSFNPLFFTKAETFFSKEKKTVFFLDYDGTLTPIVDKPSMAVLSPEMKETLRALNKTFRVAIVSGRSREDVENLVGIKELLYAGNHGFDIKGRDLELVMPQVQKFTPLIEKITERLNLKLSSIEGVIIEKKKFSAAVHYRLVNEEDFLEIKQEVESILSREPSLRVMNGKKVFELLPELDWDKGKALMWIMKALNISWDTHNVIYIGDDTTDENAFRILKTRGAGILVSSKAIASFADFFVSSTNEVKKLFEAVISEANMD